MASEKISLCLQSMRFCVFEHVPAVSVFANADSRWTD
jgi:hypothetical protein